MAREMRSKTRCMKAEMKKVEAEAYECFARERGRYNINAISEKIQTSVADRSKGASRDFRVCSFLDWQE